MPSTNPFSLALAAALVLAAPVSALAATYKCVIGGKTVYQQQTCPADAGDAQQLNIKTPSQSSPGETLTRDAAKSRKAQLEAEGPGMLRSAYQDLVGGRSDVYVANLCVRARESWSRPPMKAMVKSMGESLKKRGLDFGQTKEVTVDRVTLHGIESGGLAVNTSQAPKRVTMHANFQWENGKPCMLPLEVSH